MATLKGASGLLSPITINRLEIRNRVFMPSMLTNFATKSGDVTERLIHYYAERAKGGVGVINVEGTAVEARGTAFIRGISAADDSKIKGLSRLAKAIKAHGARASLQLIHAGRCVNPAISGHATQLISYVPRFCNHVDSVVLDREDIEEIIAAHANVARRVMEAGFDMLELHGAHGYLLSQFVSPLTNQRDDEYGGSLENRLRAPLAIIRAVRAVVGPDFPISYRFNAEDGLPGGMTTEESLKMVQPFMDAGVDVLHVSAGIGETKHLISPPSCFAEGWLADTAAKVKNATGGRVPVISVGRYVHPDLADAVIREGKADMVAFGRALIADPELINKFARGQSSAMRLCLACNEGCTGHTGKLLDITCAINPRVGFEGKYPQGVRAAVQRKVAVVGAGPAGMQAAITAAERGHAVTLFERAACVGGLLIPASRPPFKNAIADVIDVLRRELETAGVTIRCNTAATADLLRTEGFEDIIVSTGSEPVMPAFAARMGNAVTAEKVLTGETVPGKRVLIVGGGLIGCETADFLGERGHEVTVLEMLPDVAQDMEWRARHTLMPRLAAHCVSFLTETQVVETMEDGGIRVRDKYGDERMLSPFDTTVISVGYHPVSGLAKELDACGIRCRQVGDCVKPGKILDAMHAGLAAAWDV